MNIRPIVLSGQMGAKLLASRVVAIVSMGPLSYRAKLADLPAWYDLVTVTDVAVTSFTAGPADTVSVSEAFFMSSGRDIGETVTITEVTPWSLSKPIDESVAVSEAYPFSITSPLSEVVAISEDFVLGSGKDIFETITLSESFSTTGEYTLTVSETVGISELAVAMIPRGAGYINGSPINSTTLG